MLKKYIRNIALKLAGNYYNNNNSKVLFYHDLHNRLQYTDMSTSLELFKLHVDVILNQGFKIVPEITNNTKQVKIQFDDGFRGLLDCYDYLKSQQIPIEVFIITDKIGCKNYLDKTNIHDLYNDGLISFSSHTHTHSDLSNCSIEDVRNELTISKHILEDMLHQEIVSLCYPMGYFSSSVIRIANELGFTRQYSSIPGSFQNNIKKCVIRRNIAQYADVNELKTILKGSHLLFEKRYLKRHFKI